IDALHRAEGAFSLVLLTDDALIAVRDPNGFRPLALGTLPPAPGRSGAGWIVASETCAFDIVGATYVRDVEPGEILVIDRAGVERVAAGGDFHGVCLPRRHGVSQCVFEHVYFSRPDS